MFDFEYKLDNTCTFDNEMNYYIVTMKIHHMNKEFGITNTLTKSNLSNVGINDGTPFDIGKFDTFITNLQNDCSCKFVCYNMNGFYDEFEYTMNKFICTSCMYGTNNTYTVDVTDTKQELIDMLTKFIMFIKKCNIEYA